MSDSLSKIVTFDFLDAEIIANVTSEQGRSHRWLWLTKRPARMAQFSRWLLKRGKGWPANLWAGTSVTEQKRLSRVKSLLQVGDDSTTRFLSVEPQIGPVDLEPWLPSIDWVIQGGESGTQARPFEVDSAKDLRAQCRRHGVAFFLKQLGSQVLKRGKPACFEDNHAGNWEEWPRALRVRQMPKVAA